MNVYLFLVKALEVFHLFFPLAFLGVFFLLVGISARKNKLDRTLQWFFALCLALMAVMLLGYYFANNRCPLTMLSDYLNELANPGSQNIQQYRGFIVRLLEDTFGWSVSEVTVTLVLFLAIALISLTCIFMLMKPLVFKMIEFVERKSTGNNWNVS